MKLSRFIQSITLLLTLMFVSAAVAQTVTGTITGEVTDPSGAVVSGAQVVAHNVSTGVDSPTTTNKDGFYRIQSLPIGHYEVTVQAPGFNKETIPEFSLEVLQTANFNVKLTVGAASTTMHVSAASPILNTTSATLGYHYHGQHDPKLSAERPQLFRAYPVRARFHRYSRHLRHHRHRTRAWRRLRRYAQHEREPRPGEQLHAGRHRHERDVQQPDLLQPRAGVVAGSACDDRECAGRLRQRERRRRDQRVEERHQSVPRSGLWATCRTIG